MKYEILIPCLLISLLSIGGIFFFISNEEKTEQVIENILEQNSEEIIEQDVDSIIDELPKRRITVDLDKKIVGECDSGIIKCDAKNGCKEQC